MGLSDMSVCFLCHLDIWHLVFSFQLFYASLGEWRCLAFPAFFMSCLAFSAVIGGERVMWSMPSGFFPPSRQADILVEISKKKKKRRKLGWGHCDVYLRGWGKTMLREHKTYVIGGVWEADDCFDISGIHYRSKWKFTVPVFWGCCGLIVYRNFDGFW